MKRILFLFITSLFLFSQTIIELVGGRWCDCWDSVAYLTTLPGDNTNSERFEISWDQFDLPKPGGKIGTDDWVYTWNHLLKAYWCGCHEGGGKSILKSVTSYRHGFRHGMWYEYFKNGEIKTIREFKNDTLIVKERYYDDGSKYNGEYEGKKFSFILQRDILMYEEKFIDGVLSYGRYYKEKKSGLNPDDDKIIDGLKKLGVVFEEIRPGIRPRIKGTLEDYVSVGLLELDYSYKDE